MSSIIRKQFIGSLCPAADLSNGLKTVKTALEQAVNSGRLMTAGLFRYRDILFFYVEGIDEVPQPDHLLAPLASQMLTLPSPFGAVLWREMELVFCHAYPKDAADWQRRTEPDLRYGALAILNDGYMPSYVRHHVNITEEGALDGDKYLAIALYDHMLFSYNETPRVMCNIQRDLSKTSQRVKDWIQANPMNHFYRWPDQDASHYNRFHPIDTLVLVHN